MKPAPSFSESEEAGISLIPSSAADVYSVGISTGGTAEIRMAELNAQRHIIATTIDEKGAAFARDRIVEKQLEARIEVKIENVARPLPYLEKSFDYIYARLVLHYLPSIALDASLEELHRILRPKKNLFIVVRSNRTPDALAPNATYDPNTCLTTNVSINQDGTTYAYSRYFHDESSISKHVKAAGFTITSVRAYDEKLFKDFMRFEPADHTDNIIELVATK